MTPARSKQALMTSRNKDPVQVYCRIRPPDVSTMKNELLFLHVSTEESCVTVLSDTVVRVKPEETLEDYQSGTTIATEYTFTGVFDENVPQIQIFNTTTLPLIEDLLHGKNSLLFVYGVTGSGKTHTMNGELQDGGIIPRCLDIIFNSIGHVQAMKHIAVFITFVEVYNHTVFDLLDDTPIDPLHPVKIQPKILGEDQHHNMYVHAVTEVEVKSADEAADVLAKGQKRRRVAHTTVESSRSHSVFNIRVVQAPLDYQGATPEKVLTVGQLSLVDLAGSERNSRTKTSGERLREAGSINNTLMTLRSCIEILRENQQNNTAKVVPYRDSKITHLFKRYFDGEGKVRMIVCVNPRADDCDETLSVMRFAEMAQEVQIVGAVQPNIHLQMQNVKKANGTLQRQLAEHQRYAKLLEEELEKKDCLLKQREIEILNVKANEKAKRQLERENQNRELDRYRQVESQLQRQTEIFLVMRDLLDAGCSVKVPTESSDPDCRTSSTGAIPRLRVSDPKVVVTPSLRSPPVSTRKRRSRSVDPRDGSSSTTLDTDTVQPQMQCAKSITKLGNPKDV